MRYRELTILTGVIAALALAQTSASALDLLNGRVTVDTNTKNGLGASVGARLSERTSGGANVSVGGAKTAAADVDVNTGLARTLSGDAVIDLSDDKLRAKVDVNGDGVIDGNDTAHLLVDLNGDGLIDGNDNSSLLIDLNGDGLVDEDDANIKANVNLPNVGGLVGSLLPPSVIVFPPDDPIPPAKIPPAQIPGDRIADALRDIDNDDVAALKLKCADVLGSPGSYDPTTVSICQALASL